MSRPRWWLLPVAMGLSYALILTGMNTGLRLPGLGSLEPFRRLDPFDLSRSPYAVPPLREGFVSAALGRFTAEPSDARVADPGALGPARVGGAAPSVAHDNVIDAHPPTNDSLDNARPVPTLRYTAKTDTRSATREPTEPADCSAVGGTVWYRFVPPRDLTLVVDTVGSNYPIALGSFRRTDAGLALEGGCRTESYGNVVSEFRAIGGTTYLFQITGPAGGGDLVFNMATKGQPKRMRDEPANDDSNAPTLSSDGTLLAFESVATNLTSGTDGRPCVAQLALGARQIRRDTWDPGRPCKQIYVQDRATGAVTKASVSSTQEEGNGWSRTARLSGDGRYVAFESMATNLVADDTNGLQDIFVHDLVTRRTERVSVSSEGRQTEGVGYVVDGGDSFSPSISDDGRFVAFQSGAPNLVTGDTNDGHDVFVRDRSTRTTTRVSVDSAGAQIAKESKPVYEDDNADPWMNPCISPDGQLVRFTSADPDLVPNDNNGAPDVFVRDRAAGRTERVSVSSEGSEANARSGGGSHGCFTADGRLVVFDSIASNLVAGDEDIKGSDVFAHDRMAGTTRMVSDLGWYGGGLRADADWAREFVAQVLESPGRAITSYILGSCCWNRYGVISRDGRFAAYVANACGPQLPGCDGDRTYVRDLKTGSWEPIQVPPLADTWNVETSEPDLSGDGTLLAFETSAGPHVVVAGREAHLPGVNAEIWTYEVRGGLDP